MVEWIQISERRTADREDEVCGGEQSVHGSDAGRRHRAQGAGGEAVLVRGEAARRAGARSAVAVVGRQRRRGVAEDGHVPQLLGAKLARLVQSDRCRSCMYMFRSTAIA